MVGRLNEAIHGQDGPPIGEITGLPMAELVLKKSAKVIPFVKRSEPSSETGVPMKAAVGASNRIPSREDDRFRDV